MHDWSRGKRNLRSMIISHKYKFIFIKPNKVAGTSIEIALGRHCGENDIITPITDFNPKSDSTRYNQPARNYKKEGYYHHIPPAKIKRKLGAKWDEYYKFTVVRNPYDRIVSSYFWNKKRPSPVKKAENLKSLIRKALSPRAYISFFEKNKNKFLSVLLYSNLNEFEKFVQLFPKRRTNNVYYFDKQGKPVCDFYMRYENLDSDYKTICNQLGIPYSQLPKTKNKQRKEKKHYSVYYSEASKKRVQSLYKRVIDYFQYSFEQK